LRECVTIVLLSCGLVAPSAFAADVLSYNSVELQAEAQRGRAEIRIESRDFESASTLIGRLQSGMKLGGMSFSVAREARFGIDRRKAARTAV